MTTTTTTTTKLLSWVDKYRPLDFDQVVGNAKTVQILSDLAEKKTVTMPNLLVCGPSGCGKTACVNILCEKVIRDNRDARILRSSSLDERGIDNVRKTIRNFAKGRVKVGEQGYRGIEKIVVLDEAESITPGAFQALRRIMEVTSSTTRFIIVCNDSTKVIEPIQSRCAILRFAKVGDGPLRSRMKQVCDMAGVEYTTDGIDALVCVADGDVRSAINSLGSTVSGFGRVTEENVYRTCDAPRPKKILSIVSRLRDKNDFVRACRELKDVCDDGYCPSDVVSTFFKTLPRMEVRSEEQRVEIAKVIGLAQARVLGGASTYLQLAAMLWGISKALRDD